MERHDYQPFGEEWNLQPGTQPKRFTGKERDAETGLDYFGARYYGSKIGRFTTIDPVYTWRENLDDAQRWNRYAYVRNNPLRYVDPDGRELAIAIYYSGMTRQTAQAVATMVTQNLTDAGVKNVTFELTEGAPSVLTRVLYGYLPTPDSHLLELRADREGSPRIRDKDAGHNWPGRAAVATSVVGERTDDPDKFITGVANLATHEVAHEAMPIYISVAHDFMKEGGAERDSWLFDRNLAFTAAQAKRLQNRFNDWWGEED